LGALAGFARQRWDARIAYLNLKARGKVASGFHNHENFSGAARRAAAVLRKTGRLWARERASAELARKVFCRRAALADAVSKSRNMCDNGA